MMRIPIAERIYRLMLRAYPADFRHACEDELVSDFRRDRERSRYRGAIGRMRFWRHTVVDWARTAWSERRAFDRSNPQVSGAAGALSLGYAIRSLRRDPSYACVAILTLAVGMSATTVVFSLVNGLLLTPLPLPEPERLVQVEERERDNPDARMAAYGNWLDLDAEVDALEGLAAFAWDTKTLTGVDAAQRLRSRQVSGNFFDVIHVAPAMGRGFRVEEYVEGGERVVVLAHSVWTDTFGADPTILGRAIQLDAEPYTVVGVMEAGFGFPSLSQIWVPLLPPSDPQRLRRSHRYRMTGRLAAGATLAQAQEEIDVVGARISSESPETSEQDYFAAYPLLDEYVGDVRPALRLLSGAVGLVLAIACVNIAGLALARSTARRREIGMRRALGANRLQLAGLVLSEGLILGITGGAAGLALAFLGVEALISVASASIPRPENVGLSAPVFLFAAATSVASGLLVSLMPLVREARTDAAELVGGRIARGRSRSIGRRALVVGQLALAVVLVAGAGLLSRSLVRLSAVQTGVVADGVLTMSIALPNGKYPEAADTAGFFTRTLPEIEAIPGVERAAVTLTPPADPFGWRNYLTIRNRPLPENELPLASYVVVSPGYFDTLRIPLIEGRTFVPADEGRDDLIAIINRTAAETHWPEGGALGAMILGNADNPESRWARVVGVVDDVRQSLYEPPVPEVYVPVSQDTVFSFVLVARTSGDPAQYAAVIRDRLAAADPDIPVTRVMSLEERINEQTGDARFNAGLMSTFAAIALALAAVGVYGVLSYAVSLRRREFGVRTAVGATRARVVGMILREAVAIGILAVAFGVAGAVALGRTFAGLLFEVGSTDPLTLAVVAAAVTGVAVMSALAPAWRAASSDPLAVLRSD